MIKFNCPHCEIQIEAELEHAGASANCPTCAGELIVPSASNEEDPDHAIDSPALIETQPPSGNGTSVVFGPMRKKLGDLRDQIAASDAPRHAMEAMKKKATEIRDQVAASELPRKALDSAKEKAAHLRDQVAASELPKEALDAARKKVSQAREYATTSETPKIALAWLRNATRQPKYIAIFLTTFLLIYFITRNTRLTHIFTSPEANHSIFSNRKSDKDDVVGLRGGMSKVEAIKIVGTGPTSSDDDLLRKYLISGYDLILLKAPEKIALPFLSKIGLVFLNDRLQSVLYIFNNLPCQIIVERDGFVEYATDLDSTRLFGGILTDYNRDKFTHGLKAAIAANYDPVDMSKENFDFADQFKQMEGGMHIGAAASTGVCANFWSNIENRRSKIEDCTFQSRRPGYIRGDARVREDFYITFLFKKTLAESKAQNQKVIDQENILSDKKEREDRISKDAEEREKKLKEEREKTKLQQSF